MANVKQQLDIPAIPSLGTSGIVYSQSVQNQNNGILRLFFTKLLNSINALAVMAAAEASLNAPGIPGALKSQ